MKELQDPMKEKYLHVFIAGFAGGIFFHSFFNLGIVFSLFLILLGGGSFLVSYLSKNKENGIVLLSVLFLISFGIGLLRFDISLLRHSGASLENFLGDKIVLEGVIVDEPSFGEKQARLIVRTNLIKKDASSLNEGAADTIYISEKILVNTNLYPAFSYGDRIQVKGNLEKPQNFKNENEKSFNYVAYLAKDNIYYTISFSAVTLLGKGEGSAVKRKLFTFKNSLLRNLEKVLPEPHASLAGGLLVGGKNALDPDLEKDFRTAGIIHIVVLSGYNIMIVAENIMKVFSFLPRYGGICMGGVSIILFAIMTGGSATVVRASIMALIALLGRSVGRTYVVTRALFIAGFMMLLHNPKVLVFDFSFQLSFLATVGLIYCSPLVERKISFITEKWKIREYVVSTIATQIIVLPLLLYRMGEISLVSLPVNMLVLFLIPSTMFASFVTSIVVFLGTWVAMPVASLTYLFVSYELAIVELFSKLPFASVTFNHFSIWMMPAVYIFYAFVFYKMKKKPFFRRSIKSYSL